MMTYEYPVRTTSVWCTTCGYVDTVEGRVSDVLHHARYAAERHLVDTDCGGRVTFG